MTDKGPKLLRVMARDVSLGCLAEGQLRYLAANGFDVVGAAADTGCLSKVAEREGVRCVNLPMRSGIAPPADLLSLWRMIRLIRRERPDIVHANTRKGALLAMVAARLCRVPVRIYTVTSLRFESAFEPIRRLLKAVERLTCRCATEVIPDSDSVAGMLRDQGIADRPLRKVHNGNNRGIDLEYFNRDNLNVCLTYNPPAGVTTFLFVGSISKDKGVGNLARVFDRLYRRTRAQVRLLLAGNYENPADPIDDSDRRLLRQNSAVTFVGEQADLRPWLALSDVLVLPQHSDRLPDVVLEAGAMGLPVVVTDVDGANEVITHGYNGLIVPRSDDDALLQAMSRMHAKPETRRQMSAVARRVIAEKYDRRDICAAMRERYLRLLKDARTPKDK